MVCILTNILSIEAQDYVSYGKAKLRFHERLLRVHTKLLDTYEGYRTFVAISVQPHLYNRTATILKFVL